MKTFCKILAAVSLCMMWTAVRAEEPKAGAAEQQQMPQMGKPAEMDNVLKQVGTWTGDMQMRMDDTSPYTSFACTLKYESALDGCAMTSSAAATMMGMPFKGMGVLTYDRELKKWTQTWIDNMSANQYRSTGDWAGNQLTMEGTGMQMGKPWMMKEVTTAVDDTTMTWVCDVSYDAGKTWFNQMKVTYTKKM